MKQATKHVEWYHGDFSDPEAVSGSSTIFIFGRTVVRLQVDYDHVICRGVREAIFLLSASTDRAENLLVENFSKNDKICVQKYIDLSV